MSHSCNLILPEGKSLEFSRMFLDELAGVSLSFKVSQLDMSEGPCEVLPPYGSALRGLFKRVFHPQWLPVPQTFFSVSIF